MTFMVESTLNLHKWACGKDSCWMTATGIGSPVGLRALGWYVQGETIWCPMHREDGETCRHPDGGTAYDPCTVCKAQGEARVYQALCSDPVDVPGEPGATNQHDMGSVTDGYHTFAELYEHRTILFALLCDLTYPSPTDHTVPWISRLHADGTMFPGYFIAGITTPEGDATYHCRNKFWGLFKSLSIAERERAPEFDGHTPTDTLNRLLRYCQD